MRKRKSALFIIYAAERQREEHTVLLLPEHAELEGIIHVSPNSRKIRRKVIGKQRFASVTPFLDKYEVEVRAAVPPYLCLVRYGINRSAGEVLESLRDTPFQAATIGRLFDLCREHPEKRFGHRIAFLGSSWYLGSNVGINGYPWLGETRDGARTLASALDRSRFKVTWRFALQPDSTDVLEELMLQIAKGRLLVGEREAVLA